jgi:DNA-binding protein HU-beta
MLKKDLEDVLSQKLGLTKKVAKQAVDLVFDQIKAELKRGGRVLVSGFGLFEVAHRKERWGVNPRNPGQKIKIKATKVPRFKSGKALKEAIAGSK